MAPASFRGSQFQGLRAEAAGPPPLLPGLRAATTALAPPLPHSPTARRCQEAARLAEGPLGQGRPHRPGVAALDGDLRTVSPQDGQVSRGAGVVEQEGAVHQGIVGHLRGREGVNSTSITAPGVPGKGQGGRGCWRCKEHGPWAQSPRR